MVFHHNHYVLGRYRAYLNDYEIAWQAFRTKQNMSAKNWIDPEIRSSTELLKSLYYLLFFPGYFGFNWNALNDCLCDFSWINSKKIVLIHEEIPELPDKEKVIYLDILSHAVLSWKEDNSHDFEIYFKQKDEQCIEELLSLAKNKI